MHAFVLRGLGLQTLRGVSERISASPFAVFYIEYTASGMFSDVLEKYDVPHVLITI